MSQPSPEVLARLAEALQFPESFLTGDGNQDLVTVDRVSFRAMTRMTAGQRDSALGAGSLAVLLSEWIADNYHLPTPSLPDVETRDAEQAAMAVRAEWGLGDRSINNVVHLLEKHGVRVFSLGDLGREVGAFSFWYGTEPFVLLNTENTSSERSRFDGCHELGHLVLHKNGERGREAEREADSFASALLMPRSTILAARVRNPTVPSLIRRKSKWNVSLMALVRRLHEVGVLSEWHYRMLCIEAAEKGYRTNEPESAAREYSQVLQKVLEHRRRIGSPRSEIADALAIRLEDLDELLDGLVMMAVPGSATGDRTSVRKTGHLQLVTD